MSTCPLKIVVKYKEHWSYYSKDYFLTYTNKLMSSPIIIYTFFCLSGTAPSDDYDVDQFETTKSPKTAGNKWMFI